MPMSFIMSKNVEQFHQRKCQGNSWRDLQYNNNNNNNNNNNGNFICLFEVTIVKSHYVVKAILSSLIIKTFQTPGSQICFYTSFKC